MAEQEVRDIYDTNNRNEGYSPRQRIIREVEHMLGAGMIEIEPDPEHFETAFNVSLDRYRQRSCNANHEAYIFFQTTPEVNQYTLPNGITLVRRLFRRSTGGTQGGIQFDPFTAYPTQAYLMRGGMGAPGDLVTYDLYAQRQELIGRMFGQEVLYDYNQATRVLTLHRRFMSKETILLWAYMYRSEEELLADEMSRPWLRRATLANIKMMIGEARELYSALPAPGSPQLNGTALKTEAKEMLEALDKELDTGMDASDHSFGFIIG